MRVRSVLIVGGGIAGISLAITLREHGISARVVEKRSAESHEGTGIHLPGNAVRAAAKLGLEDALRQAAFRIPRIDYTDHKGMSLATLDLTKRYGPTAAWPAFYALHHQTFRRILVDRARDLQIEFDCEVKGIGRDRHGVGVTLSNGDVICPDLVVGADGINSPTRESQFGPEGAPRDMGYACWRFVTACPKGLTAPQYMLGSRRAFLVMPIDGDRVYVYAMICAGEHADGDNDLRKIFADFEGAAPKVLAQMDPASLLAGTLQQVSLKKWSIGPVVVIGDAAHATLPTLAQGAGMAMEDALVLAECLGAGQGTLDEQLAAFETRRRKRVMWVQEQSVRRMKAVAAKGALLQGMRNAVFRNIGGQMLKSGWKSLIEEPF